MGTCPNCGNKGLLLKKRECLFCGRECCERCALSVLKIGLYDKWACSIRCKQKYEDKVLDYPYGDIGTKFDDQFRSLGNELWYDACIAALDKNNPSKTSWANLLKHGRDYAEKIMLIESKSSDGRNENNLQDRFLSRLLQALAANVESVGRPLDAAKIYENLKMYDKARQLREKDKQVFVKQTTINVDLNALLQQLRSEGLIAVYRCPNCGGNLKVNKESTISSLQTCSHCGREIQAMEISEFLRTVLS